MTDKFSDTRSLALSYSPSRWRVFSVTFAIVAVLMGLWALATPLMAVPDEPAHAIRAAAVARGQIVAPPSEEIPWQLEVEVPRYVAQTGSMTCFAFNQQASAACQTPLSGDPNEIVPAPTSAGLNSPVYYALVGWPTLFLSGDVALYAMRIASALLTAALFAVSVMSLLQMSSGRWAILSATAAITPMLLFLGGAINPNGIEITAAAALFTTLTLMVQQQSTQKLLWERSALVVVSACLLVNTRSIALLWLAIIVGVAFLLSEKSVLRNLLRRPATWVAVATAAAGCLAALSWFTRPSIPVPKGELPPAPGTGGAFLSGVQYMADRTLDYMKSWIGLFGWVDQPAPELAVLIWSVILSCIVGAAVLLGRGRKRLATLILLAAAVVVPPISQGILLADYGLIWQGRYMMAIYTCLVLCAGLALDEFDRRRDSATLQRLTTAAVLALSVGHIVTFAWVLRRYVVGDGTWVEMLRAAEWQPPGTWIGLVSCFGLALTVGTLLVLRTERRGMSSTRRG